MDVFSALELIFIIFIWIIIGFLLLIFVVIRIIRKIHPFPIPAFATKLIDNSIRRKFFQKPNIITERMHLYPGMIVMELGPGKGNYTKVIARKIIPEGKLYAIDIQESIIEKLKQQAKKEGLNNIIPKVDDAYNLSFQNDSIDRIFAITCLPEIPDPIKTLKEFKRTLKPDGIISLCELFIDPDYPFRRTEKKWAKEAGLILKESHGNWFSYQLNFAKEDI